MNGTRKHREEGGESGNNSFTGPTTPPPPQFDVNSPAFLAALAAFQTMAGTNPMIPMLTMWQRPLLPQGSFNQGRPPFTPPGFSQPPPPPPPPAPPSSALPQLRPPLSPSDWETLLQRQSELRTSLPNGVTFDLHHQQQQQQLIGLNENQMLEMFKQSLQNNEISPSLMRRIQEMRNSLRPGNTGPVRRKNSTRESTQVLKNWLNNHSHNPYPSKNEKYMLALAADMSLTQVSTWFANARRRLKKERRATWIGPSGLDHLFGEQGSPFMGTSAQSNCDESEFEPESTGSQVNQSNGSSTLSESTQGVEDNDGMEKAENKKESEQIPAISQAVTPNKTSNKFWSVVDMTAES